MELAIEDGSSADVPHRLLRRPFAHPWFASDMTRKSHTVPVHCSGQAVKRSEVTGPRGKRARLTIDGYDLDIGPDLVSSTVAVPHLLLHTVLVAVAWIVEAATILETDKCVPNPT